MSFGSLSVNQLVTNTQTVFIDDLAKITGQVFSGDVTLSNQYDLRFGEATGNGANYVGFQAPSSIETNVIWTLPAVDGASGTVLSTDGSATLTWAAVTVPVVSVGGQTGVVTYANNWAVGTAASAAANTSLDVSGAYAGNIVTLGTGTSINCSSGNYFTATVSGSPTYTITGIPSGRSYGFTMEVLHSSGTITWFSGVEWAGGTAPTLTTGKTHLFMFITDDQGSRWRGSFLVNYTT